MTLTELFASEFLAKVVIKALVVGVLVSLCASLLGVSLVLKRFSMIGDALSHMGFGTLSLATILNLQNYSMEISLPLIIITAIFLLRLGENAKIKGDTAIAVVSTGSIAIGSILYNYSGNRSADICNSLFGNSTIITINNKDLALSVVLSVLVLGLFAVFYNRIFAMTFDENFAKSSGIKSDIYKTLIAVLAAVTIVVGMKLMGSIMISGLIVFPSLTSMRVFKSFRSVVISTGIIAVVCFVIGFFTACRFSYQSGATIVTVDVLAFLIFFAIGTVVSYIKKKKESPEVSASRAI